MMDKKVVKKVLVGMKELIKDEGRWTKRSYARDNRGYVIHPCDKGAVSFCLLGALDREVWARQLKDQNRWDTKEYLDSLSPLKNVLLLNDCSTHEEVVRFLNEAIGELP